MDEEAMDYRDSEKSSRVFKKSCCRNLFGARRNDPDIRAWLEKQIAGITAKNNERMREQYGIDVERNEVVESDSVERSFTVMEIQTIPGYYKSSMRPDGTASRFFTEFPPPTSKRALPHISAISPRKKFSLQPVLSSKTALSKTVSRKKSTQPTLFGSLTVRKTPSKTPSKLSSVGASSPCTITKRTGEEERTIEGPSIVSTAVSG